MPAAHVIGECGSIDARIAQCRKAGRGSPLGEALSVGTDDEGVMMIARRPQAQQRLQDALDMRCGEEVGPAHDIGDRLIGIIDDNGEVVAGQRVLARDHDVPLRQRIGGDAARARIMPGERSGERDRLCHIEPPRGVGALHDGAIAAGARIRRRQLAMRRVPRAFFQYVDSGSYAEETFRANRADMERVKLRQRVLVNVDNRDLSTNIVGQKASLPIALAPIGLCGMQHGNGEILAAEAANEAGIPFCLSTMSICSIEQVAEATKRPFWFQVYVIRDRGFIADLIARAKAANCSALVLTVDLQVLGQRHRDIKNGMTVPMKIKLANVLDVMSKPRWAMSMLNAKSKTFGNLAGHVKGMEGVNSLAQWTASQFDPTLNWKDVAWIRSLWPGKLIIKGIHDVEDAKLAAKSGADAIVVSNHGGRQLDGAPSSISMLPKIADTVGSDIEVMFDSGIRSGQDLFRALALGARSCLIGRAYIYGLGALGKPGVTTAIETIRKELDITMALTGVSRIADINRSTLASEAVPEEARVLDMTDTRKTASGR